MNNGLRGYSSRKIQISENVSIFKFYQNTHVHIAYHHCAKNQIENRTLKVFILRFKYILYDYCDSCLIFKTPNMAKPPVLQTCGNDNSKSRCGNDLKFVMAFLDMQFFRVSEGFSFN